ncbi:MAG: PaaX family transcriptional regulator C-terminal domain-containing protein [bacterium]|jgi:phenylacetic acid degradation operon negative regulatory protein|nr:PaaX family transcriptional regulator C-terminal domain-containing protein [bacterium]
MTPNPRHLILKFLLVADGEAMTAREAVAACALFGIRENSVRVALVRLAAAGMIEAAGRGSYRLGANATGLADDVSTWRTAESRVRAWSGAWIVVHCGALGRSDRSALGRRDRALQLLGFRELDREFFVRPDNMTGGVAAVRERLFKLGLDPAAAVFLATEFDAARDARARSLWDGRALTKSWRQTRQQLEKWLEHSAALEPDVAARESFLLGSAAIRQLVFDPLLPDPLVDTAQRRAFVDTVLRFDAAGHVIWQRLRLIPVAAGTPLLATSSSH